MIKRGHLKTINILSLVVIIIFNCLLTGCSTANQSVVSKPGISKVAGAIVETQLTAREKEILQGLDIDKILIYDANVKSKDIKKIDFWVDYYEKGSYKGKISGEESDVESLKTNNFKMIFSSNTSSSNRLEEKFTFSISANGYGGTGGSNINIPEMIIQKNFEKIHQSVIFLGKEIILAFITGSAGANLNIVSINALNEKDETIKDQAYKELLKNEYVYIIKCKFY